MFTKSGMKLSKHKTLRNKMSRISFQTRRNSFQLGRKSIPISLLHNCLGQGRFFFHICTLQCISKFWAKKYFQKVQYFKSQQNIGWNVFILTTHSLTNHILFFVFLLDLQKNQKLFSNGGRKFPLSYEKISTRNIKNKILICFHKLKYFMPHCLLQETIKIFRF